MIYLKSWITNFPKQYHTHQNADLPLNDYLSLYSKKFKNITIGCSFSPDLVEQLYRTENAVHKVSVEKKLDILKILVQELGMKDIRLGVKWNKVINEKGEFDFSYYHPYLEYCFSHHINICLNVGPIKTFGWPEEYIPDHVLGSVNKLDPVITMTNEITNPALDYLDELLKHIQSSYTKEQLKFLKIIQPENEVFNVFGKHKLEIREDYLYEVIKKIVAVFPHKKILLSSSETRNLPPIIKLIKKITNQSTIPGDRFTVGINYYYNLPSFLKVPKLGPIDDITISNFLQNTNHQQNIHSARRIGYDIEVTEAQFEQWGRAYLSPGNSHHEAKYLIARIVENVLDPRVGGVIRLWGFERYAKKKIDNTLTHDHQQNLELISRINLIK